MYFIVLPVVVPFNINIIIITIIFIIFLLFFFFSRLYVLCVHYRFVRFSYIGDQFIEPYGSSASLPMLSYHDNYCSLLYVAENKLVVVVESAVSSPGGSGAEPQPKSNLVHLALKDAIWWQHI